MSQQVNGYYKTTWGLIKQNPSWWKVLLILGLASLVPIAGILGCYGYQLEWARLLAWGADAPVKSKGVEIGESIKTGWRGIVVSCGWSLIAVVVVGIFIRIFSFSDFLESLFILILWIAAVFANVLITVCSLHATIYQDFKAGFKAKRLWKMISADFGGLARITGMRILITCVTGFIISLIGIFIFLPLVGGALLEGGMYFSTGYMSTPYAIGLIMRLIGSAFIPFAIVSFLLMIAAAFTELMVNGAVGLWMRQFDVPAWGSSDEPLPKRGLEAAYCGAAPAAPTASSETAPTASSETTPVAPAETTPAAPAETTPAASSEATPVASAESNESVKPIPAELNESASSELAESETVTSAPATSVSAEQTTSPEAQQAEEE